MTLRHAAMRTGLSATTLRRYIKAGRLRARLIPGRYGPEYVVDDEDLRMADLLVEASSAAAGPAAARTSEPAPAAPPVRAASIVPAPAAPLPAPPTFAGDVVPGLLYRELLMKHEHLLVQFGMLRVSGQQVYELRQDAEKREGEARRMAEELALTRDRHAREIGLLKARLRQAELEIAARDDEIGRLTSEVRRLEIAARNATTAGAMDEQFARRVAADPRDH